MPELPDVEAFRRYLDKTSLNKIIENVDIKSPELLQNVDANGLKEKLEGHKFQYSKRHGKYLFTHLDNDSWLILHFGMTGRLKYFRNADKEPLHDRILIRFEDKNFLAFDDQRKFGKINLSDEMANFIKEKRLGPDALEIDFKTFKKLLDKRKSSIKSFLMNQHILAGVGNIYADEILFQACIHPKIEVSSLNDDEMGKIFKIMKEVLKTAIDKLVTHQKFPDSYLISHRIKGGKCPNSDRMLKTIKISGRTTYYCPECQKEVF